MSTYGHGSYHSPARRAHQQTLKDRFTVPQKPTDQRIGSAGSWWLVPKEQFAAAAKSQAERLIRESAGTVIRLKEHT